MSLKDDVASAFKRCNELEAENAALRAKCERLSAPVSGEEWWSLVDQSTASRSDGCLWLTRDSLDALITARAAEPETKAK